MKGWRHFQEDAEIAILDLNSQCQNASVNKETQNSLFCIFDGHGGPQVANFCKKFFVSTLLATKEYQQGDYENALRLTFVKLDEHLASKNGKTELRKLTTDLQVAGTYKDFNNVGCAATVALITQDHVICANSGDCRTVLFQDDRVINLSIDHKASYLPEIHRVQKAGGFLSNGRVDGVLAVTRSLGDHHYKQKKPPTNCEYDWYLYNQKVSVMPDVKSIRINSSSKFLVLACDGIWDCINSSQAVQFIDQRLPLGDLKLQKQQESYNNSQKQNKQRSHLALIAEELLDTICPVNLAELQKRKGQGCDNMSLSIIQFKNENSSDKSYLTSVSQSATSTRSTSSFNKTLRKF